MDSIRPPPPCGEVHDGNRSGQEIAEKIEESLLKVVIPLLESVEIFRQSIVKTTGIQISEKEMIGVYFFYDGDVRDLPKGFYYLKDNNYKIPPQVGGDSTSDSEQDIAKEIMDICRNVTVMIDSIEKIRQVLVENNGVQISDKEMVGLYFCWKDDVRDLPKGFDYLGDNMVHTSTMGGANPCQGPQDSTRWSRWREAIYHLADGTSCLFDSPPDSYNFFF